jgi:hypothetical protein
MYARLLVLALAIACLPCAAQAQITATGEYLARMDNDRDGRVSLAEYQAWMSYAFEGMDRNRDGTLSADELPGGRGKPVTREAHLAQLAERFRRQDVDRDGFLNVKELAAPPQ